MSNLARFLAKRAKRPPENPAYCSLNVPLLSRFVADRFIAPRMQFRIIAGMFYRRYRILFGRPIFQQFFVSWFKFRQKYLNQYSNYTSALFFRQ